MPRLLLLPPILAAVIAHGGEPPARALTPLPIRVGAALTHVSAAREIPDGRLLITNAKAPSVLLLDLAKGSVMPVGAAGGGPDRYATPGGLYAGPDGATLLLDRGQTQVFTISARGELQGSRSIARQGVTTSSSADIDRQRLDAKGFAYFVDFHRPGATLGSPESTLVRFDATTQKAEVVAKLRRAEMRTTQGGDGLTLGRRIIGSPEDGWGVAPDGRVAIVRADPYRVEWISPGRAAVRGPVVEYTPVPITEADKQRHAALTGGSVSIGQTGGTGGEMPALPTLFAATKPPFEPDDILVSPDSHVWVMRTQPFEAATTIYDVFDSQGRRVDRIQLPGGSRIVGFGRNAIYARSNSADGRCELRKYGVN